MIIIRFLIFCLQLSKSHRDGHMAKVEFLDRLTFREIEMINEKQKRESNFLYLMIEFPRITMEGTDYAIVYFEKVATYIYITLYVHALSQVNLFFLDEVIVIIYAYIGMTFI